MNIFEVNSTTIKNIRVEENILLTPGSTLKKFGISF
jgi:hypothetical protein